MAFMVTEEGTVCETSFADLISSHQSNLLPTLIFFARISTFLMLASMSTASEDIDHTAIPDFAGLPSSMATAAFLGIAWFTCIDLNMRLLTRAARHSLYFWSCLLCSWGLMLHSISILLLNFNIWKAYSPIVVIELSWLAYVVAQSLVLYSRLNLVLKSAQIGRYVLYMIIIDAVIFGLTTVLLGMRHPKFTARLHDTHMVWDKVQVSVFFVQETLISILYIYETAKYLKNMELLGNCRHTTRTNLRNLILLSTSSSSSSIAASWVAVYAVKLRTEFTILSQLREALTGVSTGGSGLAAQRDIEMSLPKRNNIVEVVG